MKGIILSITLVSLLNLSGLAIASLVNLTSGVFDTDTKLYWREPALTQNKSVNDLKKSLIPQGWSLASRNDFNTLVLHAGADPLPSGTFLYSISRSEQHFDLAEYLITLLGSTYRSELGNGDYRQQTLGWLSDNDAGSHYYAMIESYSVEGVTWGSIFTHGNPVPVEPWYTLPQGGSFLVRNVPEPSAIFSSISLLILLLVARIKKY